MSLLEEKLMINIAIKKNYSVFNKIMDIKHNLYRCFVDNLKYLEIGNSENLSKLIHLFNV